MSTDRPRIALIVASTRSIRFADPIATWIRQTIEARGDLDLEVVDVRDAASPRRRRSLAVSTATTPSVRWANASTPPTAT
jgi:NAD(P)H-dependent FMN reductase